MNTPRYALGPEKGMNHHHCHPGPSISRDDPARNGVLVFDPLHAFFPVDLPNWMILVPAPDGKLPLDPWTGIHKTAGRINAIQSLSRGGRGPVPVAIFSGLPLPQADVVTLKILRDPEDVAFCLSQGAPRSGTTVTKIASLMEGVRTTFTAGADSPDTGSIVNFLGRLLAAGNGCHLRDHRWLALKVLSSHKAFQV